MNDYVHQRMVQEMVKSKFGSHAVLINKSPPHYPEQAEREFKRITNAYMRILNKALKKHLPEIKKAAEEEVGQRHDGVINLYSRLMQIFHDIQSEVDDSIERFNLSTKINYLAHVLKRLSVNEWKQTIDKTLGIQLMDDYYNGELLKELIDEWVKTNVELIRTIPQDSLSKMKDVVLNGYRGGESTSTIVKQIQRIYGTERRHAQLIARDQVAKLNGQITKAQQEDAGVKEYIWSTSGDSRVREGHRALNGKRFRWDDPPIVDAKTGRRAHPGEDYQCRCVALAVFDYNTIDLPVAENGGG